MFEETKKCNPLTRKQETRSQQKIQMLELPESDFKLGIINKMKELKEKIVIMDGRQVVSSKK